MNAWRTISRCFWGCFCLITVGCGNSSPASSPAIVDSSNVDSTAQVSEEVTVTDDVVIAKEVVNAKPAGPKPIATVQAVVFEKVVEDTNAGYAEIAEPPKTKLPEPKSSTESEKPTFPPAAYELPKLVVEGPRGAVRVSFDDLDLLKLYGVGKDVPLDVGDLFTARLRRLDGKRVRLRGFMYPAFATRGLVGFVLARDNEICCFGRDPLIYDLVPVKLAPGETTDYIDGRPFDVAGVFHIDPDVEAFQLYYIDDAVAID